MSTMNKFTSDSLSEDFHYRFSKGASRNKGKNRDSSYMLTGEGILGDISCRKPSFWPGFPRTRWWRSKEDIIGVKKYLRYTSCSERPLHFSRMKDLAYDAWRGENMVYRLLCGVLHEQL